MFNFNEFTNEIRNKVNDLVVEKKVELTTVPKNNGVNLTGICIIEDEGGISVAPMIYLDEYFQEYENGDMNIEEVVNEVLRAYSANCIFSNGGATSIINSLNSFDTAKENLDIKVINYAKNKELLDTVPHRKLLDLALIYIIKGCNTPIGQGTVTINNDMLKRWGITEKDLFDEASKNEDTVVCSMMEMLLQLSSPLCPNGIDDFDPTSDQMYIVTNKEKTNGFGNVFKGENLKRLADKFGTDLYVIPSSIHEGIVIPANVMDPYAIKDIIGDVNATMVSDMEFLSNNLYFYSRKDDRIEFAEGSGEEIAA